MNFKQLPLELNALIQSYNQVKIPENVARCIQKNVDNTIYCATIGDHSNYYNKRITKTDKYLFSVTNNMLKNFNCQSIFLVYDGSTIIIDPIFQYMWQSADY